MEKVSIARRRTQVHLLRRQTQSPPQQDPDITTDVGQGPPDCPEKTAQEARIPEAPPAPDTAVVGLLFKALGISGASCGKLAGRRLGFAVELELDPHDPSRLRLDVVPRPIKSGRFMSVRQASRMLHVSPQAIYRALADGELRGIKIGRQWRICLERPHWLGRPADTTSQPEEE